MKLTRRRMIFVGVAGVAAGAALWTVRRMPRGEEVRGAPLLASHAAWLPSVALALLGPALATNPGERDAEIKRTLQAIAALIDEMPPFTRGEIAQLFELLSLKPARTILGFSGNWSETSKVAEFLESLRHSAIGMKQQAYFALHDLVFGSFYSDPSAWRASGYRGPPKLA